MREFNIFVQAIHYPEHNSLLKFFFQKKVFFFWPNIFQYIEVFETLIIRKFERIQYLRSSYLLSRIQFSIKILLSEQTIFFFWLNISWSKSLKFFVQAIHYPERNSLLKFFLIEETIFSFDPIFQYIVVEISEILVIWKFERIQYLRSSHSLSRAQFSIKILLSEETIFFFDPERNSLLKFFIEDTIFFFDPISSNISRSLKLW